MGLSVTGPGKALCPYQRARSGGCRHRGRDDCRRW